MSTPSNSRRQFLKCAGIGTAAIAAGAIASSPGRTEETEDVDPDFFIRREELDLKFHHPAPRRRLSFGSWEGTPQAWREACRAKLAELVGLVPPGRREVRKVRSLRHGDVTLEAWIMQVDESLSIPAYLLRPGTPKWPGGALIGIHGHGEVEPLVGARDDYHHALGLEAAKAGYLVLCPALRGFGPLGDVAYGDEATCLDYWRSERGHQFTLVSEGFLHGQTLIGQTTADLMAWQEWLRRTQEVQWCDVAGISYGGDLAVTYPAFTTCIRRIYASGTLGSFTAVFSRCYNAPAHGIPGILDWMDRSDVAGLNAPRPLRLHYGERDVPGRIPNTDNLNNSASYNETVPQSLVETRAIYAAFGEPDKVTMKVTPGSWHEMDIPDFLAYLDD